ncbi:response regulator [Sulfuricurvum sp.]|uniref:response regulator n=1 Tax=Sulfuricurvum sp. TaxID=2025608 RepID=UPI0035627530
MYAKILKESAKQLTLLAVENCPTSRDAIGKHLGHFFKSITYVSNAEEALWLYKSEKFDLILVDIDTFSGDAYRFIDNVHRHDLFQAMAVCSSRSDDAELMLKLLNSQIACFIPKPAESNTMYQLLSKVCGKIQDRAVLMHYLETLENQNETALSKSCRSECPMKVELKPIQEIKPAPQSTPVDEEEDFLFFPEPSSSIPTLSEDTSIYQDYFSFLDFDDREELHDQLSDIDSSLLNAFSDRGADPQFISRLGNSLMRYGNVLLHYQFFSDMGTSILEFGKTISDESQMIAERSNEFQMLIGGFCSGLQTYMAEVWDSESANPKFFNDSIINDAQTIIGMMAPAPASSGDDDDLFFF